MSKSNSKAPDASSMGQAPASKPHGPGASAAANSDAQFARAVMTDVLSGIENLDTLGEPVRRMLEEHTPPLLPRDVAWLSVNSVGWVLAPLVYSGLTRLVPAMQMRAFSLGILHLGGVAPDALQRAGYDLRRLVAGARKVARAELIRDDGQVPPVELAELRAILLDSEASELGRADDDFSQWLVQDLEVALPLRQRGNERQSRLCTWHEAMSRAFTLQAFETTPESARKILAALRQRGALRAGRDDPIDVLRDLWIALRTKPAHLTKVWRRKADGKFGLGGRATLDAVGVNSSSQHPVVREADLAEIPADAESLSPFDEPDAGESELAAQKNELRAAIAEGLSDDVDRQNIALWAEGHQCRRERARRLKLSPPALAKRERKVVGRIARRNPELARALKASLCGPGRRKAAGKNLVSS